MTGDISSRGQITIVFYRISLAAICLAVLGTVALIDADRKARLVRHVVLERFVDLVRAIEPTIPVRPSDAEAVSTFEAVLASSLQLTNEEKTRVRELVVADSDTPLEPAIRARLGTVTTLLFEALSEPDGVQATENAVHNDTLVPMGELFGPGLEHPDDKYAQAQAIYEARIDRMLERIEETFGPEARLRAEQKMRREWSSQTYPPETPSLRSQTRKHRARSAS